MAKREIADAEYNCKSQIVSLAHFDGDAFQAALDSERQSRKLTWKKVADEAGVSASTLTRMAQGRRPDVDGLAALCRWSGINADDFFRGESERREVEAMTQLTTYLRADPNLSPEGAAALEAILRAAYERLRKE